MDQKKIKNFKVLIVEENAFIRFILKDFMDSCHYETLFVENGRLALDELRKPENNFDLVLV